MLRYFLDIRVALVCTMDRSLMTANISLSIILPHHNKEQRFDLNECISSDDNDSLFSKIFACCFAPCWIVSGSFGVHCPRGGM